MSTEIKPIVVVSKCLGFASCRYNGATIDDPVVDALKDYVEYITVCPEVEINLGIPRDPIRIVTEQGQLMLYQPATGKDITTKMTSFASSFLDSVNEVDGFILKYRSPSCGIKDVKVYPNKEKSASVSRTSGFFSAEVLKRFAFYPIEDEGRLKNFGIREHFLTKLFMFARLRNLRKTLSMGSLVEFHARNKYLLMTYSQKEMRELGRIVANHEKRRVEDVFDLYQIHFMNAFMRAPNSKTSTNTLMHVMGYFSKQLEKKEKEYFLELLEKYKNKKIPLSVPTAVIRSYIARFGQDYLEKQTLFNPFPEKLIEVTDSGKGRDI